jgi:hypothetical protein
MGVGRFVSPAFCEQKAAKKLFYSGPWAMSSPTPIPQINESFSVLFFKKARSCAGCIFFFPILGACAN